MLFAVKLSLSHIHVSPGTDCTENEKALQYTTQLLANCIQECRRISHDLTPAILEECGLKKAVEDICRQMTGPVAFKCNIQQFDQRLERFLEVAIFRIIQELMMNIVKHADASRGNITIHEKESAIHIRVRDNGKGFDETKLKNEGIGLRTIRSKVTLLTGSMKISSGAGKGTTIDIRIPKRID